MLVQKDYPGHRRQSSFCRQCSASIRRVPAGLPKSINSRIINNQKSLLEIHNLGAGWKQRQTIDNAINMVGEVFPKFAVQIRICSALWIDTKSYHRQWIELCLIKKRYNPFKIKRFWDPFHILRWRIFSIWSQKLLSEKWQSKFCNFPALF